MTMVALLTMTAAVAQNSDNNQRERRAPRQLTAEDMTNRMAKDLNLTDAQKAKVTALNNEYKDVLAGPRMRHGGHHGGPRPDGQTGATQQQDKQAKRGDKQAKKADKQAKKNDQKGERPERPQLTDEQKAQMKAQMEKRKEYDAKLKEILTEEQYKSYQQNHQHRGPRGPRGGFPNGPRLEKAQND